MKKSDMQKLDLKQAEDILERMKAALAVIDEKLEELDDEHKQFCDETQRISGAMGVDQISRIFDEYRNQMKMSSERMEEIRTVWTGMIGQIRAAETVTGEFSNKE